MHELNNCGQFVHMKKLIVAIIAASVVAIPFTSLAEDAPKSGDKAACCQKASTCGDKEKAACPASKASCSASKGSCPDAKADKTTAKTEKKAAKKNAKKTS